MSGLLRERKMQDGVRQKHRSREENICREDEKQKGAAIFRDRDLSICSAFAVDCVYIPAVYENGAVQLLQYEIYWAEEVCRAG